MDSLEKAARVLDIEIFELQRLRDRLDENFSRAVEVIKEAVDARGKVVHQRGPANAGRVSQRPFFSVLDFSMSQPLGGHQERKPASGADRAWAAQSDSLLVDRRDGAGRRAETVHFPAGPWLDPGGWLSFA